MLKIKDSVDLKELKKYGFKYSDEYGKYEYEVDNSLYISHSSMKVNVWNRKIELCAWQGIYSEKIIEKLYDLIKDGLVEKVDY